MALPADDRGWFELVLSNQAPLWRMLAEACGGSFNEDGDVKAAIVPQSPNRSFFNSVWYEDTARMTAALPELAAAYDEANVNAWAVWVPEADREAQAALEAAGHVLDSWPRTMGLDLADLRTPDPDPQLEITEQAEEEMDMEALRSINETAYGYAPGDFPPMSPMPGTMLYLAALDGETVGTTVTWERGDDCEITLVATLPEARGRGVAKRLLGHALERARDRGRAGTTLISTKLGFPVYIALGYRDVGGLQMWERRKPD
jgi:GNAT superfamily N-acetyltransferase